MMWGGWGHMYGAGPSLLGLVFLVLFTLLMLVGIGLLVFWIVRTTVRGPSGGHRTVGYGPGWQRDEAMETARHRYARGEITREEYERIVEDLGR